jgi:aspartyl-tRNA(Asn)/glutamyl-tRNA(Gln) amidotransferase subunit A
MSTTPFPDWSALDVSGRERARAQAWTRLQAWGPLLNATLEIAPELPLAGSGPLGGMMFAAKDMFDRVTRRATWGGVRPPGPAAEADAEVLDRLDAAGACQVAVSAMTEFAYEPSGFNAVHGRTLNPWHPEVVSGGSSSGSAALVACSTVFLALGSDTGGSIRMPASCCGITGLKPGSGAVPDAGAMPLAPSLDAIGLFARAARDLQLAWPIANAEPLAEAPEIGCALALEDSIEEASPAVRGAVAQGLEALHASGVAIGRTCGQAVIEEADRHALVVMQGEAARSHADACRSSLVDPLLRKRLSKGLAILDEDLAASLAAKPRLVAAFLELLGEAEVAVLPVMPFETPFARETDPGDPRFSPRVLYRMSSLTRFVNMLGLPALALPCGFDARGVPIGLQLVGRPRSEMLLLRLAARVQAITDWHGRVPPGLATEVTS